MLHPFQLNNLLKNAKFIEIKNNVLIFAVKDSFTREALIRNYFLVIKRSVADIDDSIKTQAEIVGRRVKKRFSKRV